ncbi:MAG: cobalamin biosynthesis protein [Cellvibrionales bacterium]|nr:cobalamin biosynthesis protein [Cellvibrionales bacterium]
MHIYALTEKGRLLAQKIANFYPQSSVFFKPQDFKASVQQSFMAKEPLVMICATGIVMRVLADVIHDKTQDPPVLVLDEMGQFVIPLLSGHEGGANDRAKILAEKLKAQAIITTANTYIEPIYTLGVGCERNCPIEFLEDIIYEALDNAELSLDAIASINSIDIKADEMAMLTFAEQKQLIFKTFDKNQLVTQEALLSQRSEYIFNTVGVYGVAESAALFAASELTGKAAELIQPKIKNTKATCAIARSYKQ